MLILESRRDIEDLREATQPASELFIFVTGLTQLLILLLLLGCCSRCFSGMRLKQHRGQFNFYLSLA
jgi:hypothetical protein